MLNLKYDNAKSAICVSPKITGIFNMDFPKDIRSNLDYQLEKYCQFDTPANSELGDKIFNQLNIGFVSLVSKKNIEYHVIKTVFFFSRLHKL